MPRKSNRGGRRTGKPRVAHPSRSDLNEPGPSPVHGEGARRERSLAAVPLQPTPQATAGGAPSAAEAPPGPVPGSLGALDRGTERPGEPLTAGSPTGAGAGPNALGLDQPPEPPDPIEVLASLPNASPELRALADEIHSFRKPPGAFFVDLA